MTFSISAKIHDVLQKSENSFRGPRGVVISTQGAQYLPEITLSLMVVKIKTFSISGGSQNSEKSKFFRGPSLWYPGSPVFAPNHSMSYVLPDKQHFPFASKFKMVGEIWKGIGWLDNPNL